MKTITIGRGDGCDILIDDYRISRRHAVLKVYTFGKMEIVDIGQNGTWVNGVKLRPGVPFPVKRSDVINFAEASQLDWSQVESPMKYVKIAGIVAAILVLLGLLVFWISSALSDSSTQAEETNATMVQSGDANIVKDSISVGNPYNVEKSSPSNVEKPVKEAEAQKKKEKKLPRTVQELFPQKVNKDKDKKDEKDENKKKEESKKKEEKTSKPQDVKKPEEKSSDKIIL